ncbi:TLC domain-containing protein 1 isoform X1 [Phycodurus eques]|uniref:TLC domain-containing protein 1 isoform X1 n=1 Tax=Phycodurus eques TaxID=693459 RepID=UPI002ACEDD7F|nr:TLC domain-containing protein 1 isoform X1 [Phycodurus eques]
MNLEWKRKDDTKSGSSPLAASSAHHPPHPASEDGGPGRGAQEAPGSVGGALLGALQGGPRARAEAPPARGGAPGRLPSVEVEEPLRVHGALARDRDLGRLECVGLARDDKRPPLSPHVAVLPARVRFNRIFCARRGRHHPDGTRKRILGIPHPPHASALSGDAHARPPLCCQVIWSFLYALYTQLYVGGAVVALFVEVNSVTLHLRLMLKLAGAASSTAYRVNKVLNICTFVSFRLAPQLYLTWYIGSNYSWLDNAFLFLASMMVMNVMILVYFYRLICSDFFWRGGHADRNGTRDSKKFLTD